MVSARVTAYRNAHRDRKQRDGNIYFMQMEMKKENPGQTILISDNTDLRTTPIKRVKKDMSE